MADLLPYLPLVGALVLLGALAFAPYSRLVDQTITQVGLATFGDRLRKPGAERASRANVRLNRKGSLRAAHIPETYPVYASKTLVFSVAAGVGGSVVGVYLGIGTLRILALTRGQLDVLPGVIGDYVLEITGPNPDTFALFLLLLVSTATVGALLTYGVYRARWWWPDYLANERARRIDESLQRTTAFVFALSRSGMPFSDILRILARNKAVYGEAAEELEVAVKDMDMFGTDVLEALDRVARASPSDQFSEFTQNLVSVLRSGRSLPTFLEEQHEYQREESEAQQSRFLDLLATIAEGYVTLLVAGPLFLITILVIVGLVANDTLTFLRVFVYLLLPLATVGVIVYLDGLSEPTPSPTTPDQGAEETTDDVAARSLDLGERSTASDGGDATNWARLAFYRRTKPLREWSHDPAGAVLTRPARLLVVTVPLAVAYLAAVLWLNWPVWPPERLADAATAGELPLAFLDDALVHATLLVIGTFGLVHEIAARRRRAIEAEVPDFLDRFASVNEAGMPIIESFARVVDSDLGALNTELARTWSDVRLGTSLRRALHGLDSRVRSPKLTRAVTLATNAMKTSNDIGPVLRIAARETQAARRLERERRQELMTYVVVIHISFLVFLVIIVALNTIFLPELRSIAEVTQATADSAVGVGGLGGLEDISTESINDYQTLLFHSTLIQAVNSGFVAGEMGEGDVQAGAKHATIMLALAYVVIVFLS